ncbi:major facilitator superfamily domain-containing protein [Cladorrhinum sp. PSN332]|nr:major facilitator superfamily domain-containing protein [Cladorrhinum sp. PSN332]
MATQTQTISSLDASSPNNTNPNKAGSIELIPIPPPRNETANPDNPPACSANSNTKPLKSITLLLLPLCLSSFLSALDLTIITPAIPSIVSSFPSSSSSGGYIWLGSAFILAHSASTPIWGSLSDIWGRKPIILSSLTLFLVGSLICALAKTMDTLIGGRVLQGLGASGMTMLVKIIICDSFSLRDRAVYLAVTSVVWAVGSGVGPVLGGVFTEGVGWRWCFWINLPIGAVVWLVLAFYLDVPNPKTPVWTGLKAVDWTGSILIIGGTLMILLGLDFGDVMFPWESATVINLLVFGSLVLGLFLLNESKFALNPLIPLRLLTSRSTVAAYGVFAFNSYVFIGIAYYLPLYSQSVYGVDALMSGVHLIPLIVAASVSGAFAGVFIQRTGKYLPIMYIAQICLTLGVGLFVSLGFEQDLTKLFIFEILAGAGVGMNIEGPMLAAQAAASELDTAAIIATMNFGRALATAVSVVVGGVIFQNEMNGKQPGLVEELGAELAGSFNGEQATASLDLIHSLSEEQQNIVRRTYFESLRSVWIMYVAFAGVSTLLNFMIRGHHLSKEHKEVVLGVQREKKETPVVSEQTNNTNGVEGSGSSPPVVSSSE